MLVREVERYSFGRGILILDEFESFINEPSSLKWISKFTKSLQRVPVVIICNAVDKSFVRLRDASTVVEFKAYTNHEMCATLLRLSSKISGFCHLPPMDCYFIANMSSGDVCHTVNQLHMLYLGTKPVKPVKSKQSKRLEKRQKLAKVQTKCVKDSSLNTWSNTHRATSLENFVQKASSTTESTQLLYSMNRDFMMSLGNNLTKEYLNYFHNGSKDSMADISVCADSLSAADCGLLSKAMTEDRLYESENSDLWGDESIGFQAEVCTCLRVLRGKANAPIILRRKSARKMFKY